MSAKARMGASVLAGCAPRKARGERMAMELELDERLNMADFFLGARLREGRGDRIALVIDRTGEPPVALTYAEVAQEVDRYAHALHALGVEPEQRVLLALEDGL